VRDRVLAWRLRRGRKATHLGLRVTCARLPDLEMQEQMRERYRGELGRVLEELHWFMSFHDEEGRWLEEIVVTPHLPEMLLGGRPAKTGRGRC
jgi:hypothetical protein